MHSVKCVRWRCTTGGNWRNKKNRLSIMLQNMIGSKRGGSYSTGAVNDDADTVQPGGCTNYQRNPSLAEQTLSRYKPHQQERPNVPTKFNPATGKNHAWNEKEQFLSAFPIGFVGCYICGSTDHKLACDCPIAQSGNYNRKLFFLEL